MISCITRYAMICFGQLGLTARPKEDRHDKENDGFQQVRHRQAP